MKLMHNGRELKAWRVYGREGHRMRESFGKTSEHNFERESGKVNVIVYREDCTYTNDYVIVSITGANEKACVGELMGQISDGIFENCHVGKIEEIF